MGNVLAAFRWKDYIRELGIVSDKAERLAKATVLGPMWSEYDRGEMSEKAVMEACIALDPEIENEIREFFRDTRPMIKEYDYSKKLLASVKEKGYNVFILSNFSKSLFEYELRTCSFFGIEDGMVISYREKLIKPDRRIYEVLLERYGLKAEESVFLDDSKENIETARKLGMKGIVFVSLEQSLRELEEICSDEGLARFILEQL